MSNEQRENGKHKRHNRQSHMKEQIANFSGEREALEMNRNHSSRREPPAFNGNEQEPKRQRQIRYYHERRGSRRNQAVRRSALMFGAPNTQGQRETPSKEHRGYRQKQSVSRAHQQQRRHGTVISKRESHVAAKHRTQPMHIANWQRTVQFILSPQRADGFWSNLRVQAHFVKIVSGSKHRKQEGKYRHSCEQKTGVPDSAQQIMHQDSGACDKAGCNRGTTANSSRVIAV